MGRARQRVHRVPRLAFPGLWRALPRRAWRLWVTDLVRHPQSRGMTRQPPSLEASTGGPDLDGSLRVMDRARRHASDRNPVEGFDWSRPTRVADRTPSGHCDPHRGRARESMEEVLMLAVVRRKRPAPDPDVPGPWPPWRNRPAGSRRGSGMRCRRTAALRRTRTDPTRSDTPGTAASPVDSYSCDCCASDEEADRRRAQARRRNGGCGVQAQKAAEDERLARRTTVRSPGREYLGPGPRLRGSRGRLRSFARAAGYGHHPPRRARWSPKSIETVQRDQMLRAIWKKGPGSCGQVGAWPDAQ